MTTPPPVPPVPHPEDVRARNERMANALCPTCGAQGASTDAGRYLLQRTAGFAEGVSARACSSCGQLTFFL